MNQNLILRIVGVILCIEALCMIPPLLLSVSLLLFEAKGPDFFLPQLPPDNS